MKYPVVATDYDGTLAKGGEVAATTWNALRKLRESGRKVMLVTGRELEDLRSVCPSLEKFDCVVAENGAVLFWPATGVADVLAEAPPPTFALALASRGVPSLSVGHVIVSTVRPHEVVVLETIQEMGLELQIIFNQHSVMVLPTGVNKGTGLAAALAKLGLETQDAVGIGDAENDHALLSACGFGVAVGDAVPALKEHADWVTSGGAGDAVVELTERLLANDLPPSRRTTPSSLPSSVPLSSAGTVSSSLPRAS